MLPELFAISRPMRRMLKIRSQVELIMFRKTTLLALIFLQLYVLGLAANKPLVSGGTVATIRLPIPDNPNERKYLGVSGKHPFTIPQVKADLVIIEVFSLYCPQCQTAAPEVNALYQMIEAIPHLKGKTKMIGVGAGNSIVEINTFKEKHRVPFPLFPDPDFAIHKLLEEVRTPYFMVVKLDKNRTCRVIHVKEGPFGEAENFLQQVIETAGLK
jgi:peroxiredoxin